MIRKLKRFLCSRDWHNYKEADKLSPYYRRLRCTWCGTVDFRSNK